MWLYETLVRGGRLHNALELLRATRDAGVEGLETRVSHKSFLTQCAKRGAVAVAFDFVAFVDAPDVRLYNMLLSACAKAGCQPRKHATISPMLARMAWPS